jgi:hypothetical protein
MVIYGTRRRPRSASSWSPAIPGVIVGIFLAAMIYGWFGSAPARAATFRTPPAERRASLVRVWPSLLLILLVLIMLYPASQRRPRSARWRPARRADRRCVRPPHVAEAIDALSRPSAPRR